MNANESKFEFNDSPPRNQRTDRDLAYSEFETVGVKREDIWEIGVEAALIEFERYPHNSRKPNVNPKYEGEGVYYAVIENGKPHSTWISLKESSAKSSLYPMIFGAIDKGNLDFDEPYLALNPSSNQKRGIELNVDDWIQEHWRREEIRGGYPSGSWPDSPTILESYKLIEDFKNPPAVTCIVLLPGRNGWEAISNLCLGGNQPETYLYVAFAKRWYERYGAEIVTIDSDTLEFRVSRPPATRKEAMQVAKEMIAFCDDVMHNSDTYGKAFECPEDVAAYAMNSRVWRFWWD